MGRTDRHGVSAGKTKTKLFLCNNAAVLRDNEPSLCNNAAVLRDKKSLSSVTVMLCINSVLEVDTFTVLLCRKNGLFLFIALQRMDAFCKKVVSGFQFGR